MTNRFLSLKRSGQILAVLAFLCQLAPALSFAFPTEQVQKSQTTLILKFSTHNLAKSSNAERFLQTIFDAANFRNVQFKSRPVFYSTASEPFLDSYAILSFEDNLSLPAALAVLQNHSAIEYVQYNHYFETDHVNPNDSLFAEQWGLSAVRASRAWETETGASEIIIAVIDTGIEDQHPDLKRAIWINAGEDLNQNGVSDHEDLNGIDDDGNGFVDDIRGWDFTDAPNFVDGGDYLARDNDPSDEHGHGTSVSGIIAAEMNNGLGVSGLAPSCRIMNLRAGTSQGLLEEDDVAAAIVYAVQNGASVINMSFGDTVVSPFLRDVIQYAHKRGVVLVASAGNSGTDLPHYPSGFSETVSVGAIQQNLALAGFSNFGATVDLVAPGQQIWTTKKGGEYHLFSGTSASAPFVSALAGLLLSSRPELTPAQIKSILTTTAMDLGDEGWDAQFGAGLIDAAFAIEAEHAAIAEIKSPKMDAGFAPETVTIRGTASGAFLANYSLSYRAATSSENWSEITFVENRQIIDDSLGVWQTENIPDGEYLLRLEVVEQNGARIEDNVRVFLDGTPPSIQNVAVTPMLDRDQHAALISFETDDISSAMLNWRARGSSEFRQIPFNFVVNKHRLLFPDAFSNGEAVDFFIIAKNAAGLSAQLPDDGSFYEINFSEQPVITSHFAASTTQIQSGFLLSQFVDLNQNGRTEIVLAPTGQDGGLEELQIFEKSGEGFVEAFTFSKPLFPRDVGDSDGDGLQEVLAGFGPSSFVFEASSKNAFPANMVWADSTNDFWAARFADADSDGFGEIIARVSNEWQVWENAGDNNFAFAASLPNFTGGDNLTGPPRAEIADFDGDGKTELLFGDFDGDIFIYEANGDNVYQPTWSDSLPLLNTTDFIKAGDFDGDGVTDFAVACHTDPDLNTEHQFDARHWLVRIYRGIGNDQFDAVWEQAFFGFFPPKDFDSGLGAGDLDGDGTDELFLSLFPDLYVIKYQSPENAFRSVWHFRTTQSNAIVAGGQNAPPGFFFNDGQSILSVTMPDFSSQPPAPLGFDAFALNEKSVRLRWNASTSAQAWRVYRGLSENEKTFLLSTQKAFATDASVIGNQTYFYAVSAVDSSFASPESALSPSLAVTPAQGPSLLQAQFVPESHVQLLFSKPMGGSAKIASNFVADGEKIPTSAVLASGGREVVLTFETLSPGEHEITAKNLSGVDRTPLNLNASSANFHVSEPEKRFYLISAEIIDDQSLRIIFNMLVDPADAVKKDHFLASAPLKISQTFPDPDDDSAVLLKFEGQRSLAPRGVPYTITVSGLSSLTGVVLRKGEGDVIGFEPIVEGLERLFIYPNPFNPKADGAVSVSGLPENSEVFVFDETGRVVRTLSERIANNVMRWDGTDDGGKAVAGGIYIVLARHDGKKAFAKIAVIR